MTIINNRPPLPHYNKLPQPPSTTRTVTCAPITSPRYMITSPPVYYYFPPELSDPQEETMRIPDWYRVWFPPMEDTYFGRQQRYGR